VVTVLEELSAAAHDVDDTGLALSAGTIETAFQGRQAAGLVEPLALGAIPPGARLLPLSPIGWDRRCISVRTPVSKHWMCAS
jgi:hypothetical protein